MSLRCIKPVLQAITVIACLSSSAVGAQPAAAVGNRDLTSSDLASSDFAAFGQATYVNQYKPAFGARYSGTNSLSPNAERSYSATMTAFLGWRPWNGGELFFNPEAARGVPLSRLAGLGGLTNGELARTSGAAWTVYRARLFVRHTWNQSADGENVASEANQMAGRLAARRWVLTVGNLSALDLFDDNSYAKDPRGDFLNWSLMSYGAWDYPADARGYSWGAALEYVHDAWAFRAGRFMMPAESNGLRLNAQIFRSYGDQVELVRMHEFAQRPGKMSLLLFHTRAQMGSFRESINQAQNSGAVPDLAATRQSRDKWGFGYSIEQSFSPSIGGFMRASWNNGQAETFAFTEIDRSISAGLVIDGHTWQRPKDRIGLALVRNGVSGSHRDYLAAGGNGFFLGDGALRYRSEHIIESFYRWQIERRLALSANLQWISNPAYNADRGPVRALGVRAHVEF